ncbi:MAG: molecular chaperone DnaK [Erysipelotrichaceae bacterium]|nr:MAG: molecular chaperone DnaK [Erysipelotrichaceae bacterium]
MIKEAEEHKAEDERLKEEAELKNKAEQFINQIDQALENDTKMDPNQKAEVIKLKEELQQAIKDNNIDLLRTKLDELEKAAQAMSEAMYKQADEQNQGQDQTQNDQGPQDDNVVDAEFKEK